MPDLYDPKFNKVIDHFLCTGSLRTGEWDDITDTQKDIIKMLDRALTRINNGTKTN